MSKTVTLRFRCTPEEAAEIRVRAIGTGNLSTYLRLRALGDQEAQIRKAVPDLDAKGRELDEEDEFKRRVAHHKLRMPTPAAERLARKELDVP